MRISPLLSLTISLFSLPQLQQCPHDLACGSDDQTSPRRQPVRVPHLSLPVYPRPEFLREDPHETKGSGGCLWGQGGVCQRRQHGQSVPLVFTKHGVVEYNHGGIDWMASANHPCSTAQCPSESCNGDRAYFFQLQIRSADEPMTTFLKVGACFLMLVLQDALHWALLTLLIVYHVRCQMERKLNVFFPFLFLSILYSFDISHLLFLVPGCLPLVTLSLSTQ